MTIKAWLRQPTTIHGFAALCAAIVGAVAEYYLHQVTMAGAISMVAYALVHILMPEASIDPATLETMVADAVDAQMAKRLSQSSTALTIDAMRTLVASLGDALPPAPPAK